jgi:hypothetical protein
MPDRGRSGAQRAPQASSIARRAIPARTIFKGVS